MKRKISSLESAFIAVRFICGISILFLNLNLSFGQPVDSIIRLARSEMFRDPQKASEYLQPALEKSMSMNAYADIVTIIHQKAIIEIIKGNPAGKDSLNRLALHYAMLSKDSFLIANSLTKSATDFKNSGKADSAVAMCHLAIRLYNAQSNYANAWGCYAVLGEIYFQAERFDEAEVHFLKAWDLVKQEKVPKDQFVVATFLQDYYITTSQHEKYAVILETLLKNNPNFSPLEESNAHYHALVRVFNRDEESSEELMNSIALHRRMNQRLSLAEGLTRLGISLSAKGLYKEGFDTLKTALELNYHSLPHRMIVYYKLYENRKAAGDMESALDYFGKYHSARDSVQNENSTIHIRELEIKFETKEKELALLKAKEISRQRTRQRNMLWVGGALTVWFSLFGILFFWHKARLSKQDAHQSEVVNQQKILQLEQDKRLLAMSSMIGGQEAERKRIAQDLHDGLGGLLSSVKAQINLIQFRVDTLASGELYTKANTLIDNASSELRRIAYNMMPSSLSRLGLASALEDLAASVQSDHRLTTHLQLFGMKDRLHETVEIMIYRIIQELLNNIVKHAAASEVLIQINQIDHELFLIVEDDGIGIDPGKLQDSKGIGMKSIESRVKFLNGTLDLSTGEKGTCVSIHVNV